MKNFSMHLFRTTALAAGVSLALTGLASAQSPQTQASESARLAEIARVAAQQFEVARANAAAEVDGAQTRPTAPVPEPAAETALTLADATEIGRAHV